MKPRLNYALELIRGVFGLGLKSKLVGGMDVGSSTWGTNGVFFEEGDGLNNNKGLVEGYSKFNRETTTKSSLPHICEFRDLTLASNR